MIHPSAVPSARRVSDRPGRAGLMLETIGMTKHFGAHVALDDVSIRIRAGTIHALLGENGAGKSTLVKCIMGEHRPTRGQLLLDNREVAIDGIRDAHQHGMGMVYQHFTLVPSLSAAENLVMARPEVPALIDWRAEKARLHAFLERMPFRLPLDRPVASFAAGERQKLEILKQLYLARRLLILDEPTSALTPGEADQVLSLLRTLTRSEGLTVIMISHKFREVMQYADDVSVLRRGRLAGAGTVGDLSVDAMSRMMVGDAVLREAAPRRTWNFAAQPVALALERISAADDDGLPAVREVSLAVRAGEVVGIAGVSGNGQAELVEVLSGQRAASGGRLQVNQRVYRPLRAQMRAGKVFCLPEEPLRNAAVAQMTVAENIAFRVFDQPGLRGVGGWLSPARIRAYARRLIAAYRVKTASPDEPISNLSGGNVQRAILSRELSGDVDVLIVANPCFGLDFASAAEIRARIVEQRNRGAAVLLISEDLDEIVELADRIAVMSEGRIVYDAPAHETDQQAIARAMAGAATDALSVQPA
ncbi:ABC transporter ATP-binding protein [Paraburkholderia humisilvae]|uniref:Ribose import ATP-binding protein RbsA n=1 Tax=Paraburkholderia humisilvae TaxID=627669 RepID=A0A6J5E1G6_9BURK|nr:ABC transporter ATP-binding protein [Paraburkholderia humisilvae]CAB3759847.1 Ribose import ATP-binding protein RbsA [Paraburkholderia humisilvae]